MRVYHTLPDVPPGSRAIALGLFEGLHRGHRAVLDALAVGAAPKNLMPCVFTFSTNHTRPDSKRSGSRLITETRRDKMFEAMGVDAIIQPEFDEIRGIEPGRFAAEVLAGKLGAGFVCCGENFHFGKGASASALDLQAILAPLGVDVRVVPLVYSLGGTISTTRIRALVESGDIPAANELLGRAFSFDFPVESGQRLGRKLGWPTINQPFPSDFAVPRFGVYASAATINGSCHASVTNIGVKPTVGGGRILAETYIHGFSGDLYGQSVLIELFAFIREERRFPGIDELRAQIQRDSETALGIIKPYIAKTRRKRPC